MTRLSSGIPLVARTTELGSLRAALRRAERGEPGVVLLSGDAGLGKSRLFDELGRAAETAGAVVLNGRCLDLADGGLPYLPFAEALGSLAARPEPAFAEAVGERQALGRMLPQLAGGRADAGYSGESRDSGMLGGLETVPHEQDVGQLQLFDAVLGLLGDVAEQRTLVLLLEDLHWADSSTRALFSFLASRLRRGRVLLAASYRTEDVTRTHPLRGLLAEVVRLERVERIELAPLWASEARTLVAELSGGELNEETLERIVERGEGNPFCTEELVAAVRAGSGPGDLPAGLADVLLARLERLAGSVQEVLRALSVADGPASDDALSDVTDLAETELDEALRAAVRENVLVIDGQFYGFRHPLMREAIYGDLLPGERTRLHARYAARLRDRVAKRGDAALLAHHSMHSNDLPTALTASVEGAEEAGEWGGAPTAALRLTEQALRVRDAVPAERRPGHADELHLLYRAANYASKSGRPERAIAYARSATEVVDEVGEPDRAARAWRRLAKTLSFQDDSDQQACAAIERAWRLLSDAEPSVARARVLATRAELLRATGAYAESVWSAREAVFDADSAGAPDAAADALITIAVATERRGDVDEARAQLREAIRQATEAEVVQEELRAWHFLGLSHDDAGGLSEARRVYQEGIARAASTGLTWSAWGIELHTRAVVLAHTIGEWPSDQQDGASRADSGAVAARTGTGRVATAVAQGRFGDAERLLEAIRPHWRTEIRVATSYASAGCELAYWRGDYPLALRFARDGIELLEGFRPWQLGGLRLGALGLHACVAMAESSSETDDDPTRAGGDLIEHVRGCATHGRPHAGTLGPEGKAWLARAEATASALRGRADPALWAEAVAAFDYGAEYEQAVCRFHYVDAMLASTHRAGSAAVSEQLRTAHELAQRLHARPLEEALRGLARRGRVELAGTAPPHTGDTLLTVRELAVLERVAAGETNRQAGQWLYISEKTVSVHLSRLMAKLGAASRAEAVALAHDRGLLTHRG